MGIVWSTRGDSSNARRAPRRYAQRIRSGGEGQDWATEKKRPRVRRRAARSHASGRARAPRGRCSSGRCEAPELALQREGMHAFAARPCAGCGCRRIRTNRSIAVRNKAGSRQNEEAGTVRPMPDAHGLIRFTHGGRPQAHPARPRPRAASQFRAGSEALHLNAAFAVAQHRQPREHSRRALFDRGKKGIEPPPTDACCSRAARRCSRRRRPCAASCGSWRAGGRPRRHRRRSYPTRSRWDGRDAAAAGPPAPEGRGRESRRRGNRQGGPERTLRPGHPRHDVCPAIAALSVTPLGSHRLRMACRPGHPLTALPGFTWRTSCASPWSGPSWERRW